jgi:hypothetical protein
MLPSLYLSRSLILMSTNTFLIYITLILYKRTSYLLLLWYIEDVILGRPVPFNLTYFFYINHKNTIDIKITIIGLFIYISKFSHIVNVNVDQLHDHIEIYQYSHLCILQLIFHLNRNYIQNYYSRRII